MYDSVSFIGKQSCSLLHMYNGNFLQINGGQTVTGLKRIEGLTVVSNNVEVTGRTGDDALVDFSSEVVYLTEAPTISGKNFKVICQ